MTLFAFFARVADEKPALERGTSGNFHSATGHIQSLQEPQCFINICAGSMSIENFSADFSLSHAIW
jgi:hypothetical protein